MAIVQMIFNKQVWDEITQGFDVEIAKKAWRKSLTRARGPFDKRVMKEVLEHVKLPKAGRKKIWKEFTWVKLNRRGNLQEMSLSFFAKSGGPELIHFVVGRRRPRKMKDVKPISKRKPLIVEVRPGKREIAPGAFIAKTSTGYHVFKRGKSFTTKGKREGNGKQRIMKLQRGKIMWTLFNRSSFVGPIFRDMSEQLTKDFLHDYKFRIENPGLKARKN